MSSTSGAASVALISDAVKSVSDSFTSTFVSAGQAVTGTATSIVSGAKSVVGDTAGAITSAVSSVAQGISALTASLGPVGAVIGGVVSAVSTVTGAVVGVASAVASSVLTIGSAVLTTATSIVSTTVSLIGSAISTCSTFISTVAGLFSGATAALSALGPVVAAVTGIFAGVANIVGSVIGALTSVVTGIVSAVTSVVSAVTAAFKSVSEAVGALAGIAGEALGGFINAIQSCVESLISFAQNVTSISNHTGMDLSQASSLSTDFQALGISSKETAQMFNSLSMRPELFNARSGSTGLAGLSDPNFLVNEAKRFQAIMRQNGIGAARSRLDAQFGGKAPEAILRIVNMDPQKLQSNLNYGREINKDLGVGPAAIKAASEDLPLLMTRVSTFVDAVKMRFAADLLPALEAAFSVVSNVFKSNAGNISGLLQSITRTIFVEGPDLAANAALTVIDWATALVDVFLNVADAGLALLESFGNRDGALYNILMAGARFVDGLTSIGTFISAGIAFIQAMFENNMHYLMDAMVTAINVFAPGVGDYLKGLSGFEFEARNPLDAFNEAMDQGSKNSAQSAVNSMSDSTQQWDIAGKRAQVAQVRSEAHSIAQAGKSGVKNVQNQFGSKEGREKTFSDKLLEVNERSVSVQERQLDVAQRQLDATNGGQAAAGSSGQIIARMSAYLAQDAYRLTSR